MRNATPKATQPFRLRNPLTKHPFKAIGALGVRGLERVSGLAQLQRFYERFKAESGSEDFVTRVLDMLKVRADIPQQELDSVPESGSLLVVCNHPFGMVEGLLLLRLLRERRSDVKVLANDLLARIPEFREFLIGVNPYDVSNAKEKNLAPLRESIQWLKKGGVLLTFPAGDVARFFWKRRAISDPEWNPMIARIARKSGADVLPLYVHGRNSPLFYSLGCFHPLLRTLQLPRQLLNKRGRNIGVRVGSVIPCRYLDKLESDSARVGYMRVRSFILKGRTTSDPLPKPQESHYADIAPMPESNDLAEELAGLPKRQVLVDREDFKVFALRAYQAPKVMQGIGVAREITFRDNHEGTGHAFDLDEYDGYYVHLLLWDVKKQAIAGGYRLGASDEILPSYGVKGLYTRNLFRFNHKLIDSLTPALELGRSFVALDYQRQMAPLMLLWQGIGAYLVQNPRYRYLFGPVSINAEYHTHSKEILMAFLRDDAHSSPLGKKVKAKTPPKLLKPYRMLPRVAVPSVLRDIDAVSGVIREIEEDHKGVPILIKHYLRLGAQFLSFNIDANFGHVLDGLLLVDLLEAPQATLRRYMGSGVDSFLAHHNDALIGVVNDTSH